MGVSGSLTKPRIKVILTTPRKVEFDGCNKAAAACSSKMGLFDNAQLLVLPAKCTEEALFEDRVCRIELVMQDQLLNFGSRVANKYLSVSAFLQVPIVRAFHRAYVSLPEEDVATFRRISWYCAAFDSARGIFPESSSSSVVKKATA